MPESLTPPQGLIAVTERRRIYGFPMGIGTGGAGTKVTASPPPAYKSGAGMRVMIMEGTFSPYVKPQVQENPSFVEGNGAGLRIAIITPHTVDAGAATRITVVTPTTIQSGSGTGVTGVDVQSI
ncbi:hypothetical protein FGU65_09305 [Methanoculleus sp. FWC-SCC1]|uniref:Uncharacterized protein n=1 Tax=Methanoculleus frigidifontis TaxID=2584085 RepID=A0ABT8MB22_9EURY|nr:hypothetical protein [Methanoculleus sp. FWC-SCC1]MDN7025081.1 hypothetical protein [Methanoculleus sp. FWC-SCC1]